MEQEIRNKGIRMITTDYETESYWNEQVLKQEKVTDCMHVLNVFPSITIQKFEGFGGAFTEASAENFFKLENVVKEDFISSYFGKQGLCYGMGRITMNSCDFALGNYTYVAEEDETLDTFDISHDKEKIIPMLRMAIQESGAKEGFQLLVSPWSPPAYMKTNGDMNHGGCLKETYYGLWADYFVKFIKAYQEEGIQIDYLTVQNEPAAVQTWDSCIYSAEQEASFVHEYLKPRLEKASLSHIKILIWDHNKEELLDRVTQSFGVQGAEDDIYGAAVHWYTGDHFDAIRAVKIKYPNVKVFFTEGCVEYSRFADSGEIQKAEMYAHDMIGNFKAGVEAFLDWNLLLDEKGGPNHVGNYCDAPIMCDGNGGIKKHLTYYYIGQFSRYIKPGAVQIMTSSYTEDLESVAFLNPDGEKVVILLNRKAHNLNVTLRDCGYGHELCIRAHTIVTVCYY